MRSSSLYLEISEKIIEAIQSGEYPENSPLPSERALSEKYHVSRSTIREALGKLKNDYIIYTIHGNGSYVKPQVFNQPLTKFYSFTDELKNSNILIHNTVIDCHLVENQPDLNSKFHLSGSNAFHKITRLRSARDYPLMIETTYLPRNRFYKIDSDILEKHSLYQYLEQKYDFHVTRATEQFRPIIPSAFEREHLQISSSTPCMLLERLSYEEDQLIEYTQSIIRGDKYTFSVDLCFDQQNKI